MCLCSVIFHSVSFCLFSLHSTLSKSPFIHNSAVAEAQRQTNKIYVQNVIQEMKKNACDYYSFGFDALDCSCACHCIAYSVVPWHCEAENSAVKPKHGSPGMMVQFVREYFHDDHHHHQRH